MALILRVVALKAGWMACVVGAANGSPWVGPVVILWVAALSLNFSRDYMVDAILGAVALSVGWVTDCGMVAGGVIAFPEQAQFGFLVPVWMMALWFQLGIHLRSLMAFTKGAPLLAFFIGAVVGPLACLAGRGLGAVEFNATLSGLGWLAAQYGLSVLLLVRLLARIDGLTPRLFNDAPTVSLDAHGESS